MTPNNFNFDNVSTYYLEHEFNIDDESRTQTMVDYQDYLLKQQDKLITSLQQDRETSINTIKQLKDIIDHQHKLINILKNSIKNRPTNQ